MEATSQKSKMGNKMLIRPLVIGLVLAVLAFLSYHQGLLESLELKSLDLRFRVRGPIPSQLPILIVSIDQDSFDNLDLPWRWPRSLHAKLIRKLAAGQPKIIAFDIVFSEPEVDPREDQALGEAIRDAGNVILAAEFTETPGDFGLTRTMNLPTPLIREHALGYGPVNIILDRDGIVRRAQPSLHFQDRIFPGFAYQIYQGIVGKEKLEGKEIPTTPYVINFRSGGRNYPVVPYYRILGDEIESSIFRDKIVMVGAFAPILHDLFPTPFSAHQPTAGVEILANLLETLAANDPIIAARLWLHHTIFFLLLVATILISMYSKPLRAAATVFLLAGGYGVAAYYLFSVHQLWLPLVPPLSGVLLCYGGITLDNYVREQKERIRMREILQRYVSADVAEELLEDRESLGLSGKRRHITVLFSDIRGFTSISEEISPEQVVSLLTDYLSRVTEIVFKHGGTIDKFIGDAVFAIFGAPKSHEDNALRAVKAGVEIVALAESLTPEWTRTTGRPLKIGVGINTGEAVVGSVGSQIRSDYTAIGDTVNLGSRLEGLTKELGVPMLISEYTAAELNGAVPLKPLHHVKVMGREAPLLVYCPESLLEGKAEAAVEQAATYVQQRK